MEIEKVRILEDLQSRFAVDVAGIYNRFSYIVDAWSGEKDPYRYDDIAEFVDEKFPDMSDQIERIEGEYSEKAVEVDADAIEYSDRRNFFYAWSILSKLYGGWYVYDFFEYQED